MTEITYFRRVRPSLPTRDVKAGITSFEKYTVPSQSNEQAALVKEPGQLPERRLPSVVTSTLAGHRDRSNGETLTNSTDAKNFRPANYRKNREHRSPVSIPGTGADKLPFPR